MRISSVSPDRALTNLAKSFLVEVSETEGQDIPSPHHRVRYTWIGRAISDSDPDSNGLVKACQAYLPRHSEISIVYCCRRRELKT